MPHDSDECRRAAEGVLARIGQLEHDRASGAGDEVRSGSVGEEGDRLRLIVPHGYEDLVEPLVAQFGSRLMVEYDDGWRAWAPITDPPWRQHGDT
jgi:hypothetical protein